MECGLLLDVGRKFWPIEDLKKLIDLLSRLGMSHLQLHLSENLAFRLDFASKGKQAYSKLELLELSDYAKEKQIELIPDIDLPGHLGALLKNMPDFALPDSDGQALDVTNEQAVNWALVQLSLALEYFPQAKIIHIGADEFVDFRQLSNYPYLLQKTTEFYGAEASGLEFYIAFINRASQFLSEQGLRVRVWNDGLCRLGKKCLLPLSKTLEICYWTRWDSEMASVQTFLEQGYSLLNFCDNDLYYVLGEQAGYSYPTREKLAQTAQINKFAQAQYLSRDEMKQVCGSYFSVWSDLPEAKTSAEIQLDLQQLLPVFVEKYKGT